MTDPLENFAIFQAQCNKVYNDQGEYNLLILFQYNKFCLVVWT